MNAIARTVLTPLAFLALLAAVRAQEKADPFVKWEKDIQAFEKKDKESPPPKNAVVFVGSSSIRLWDLAKSFPDADVVNRGFGGSKIPDSTHFAARILLPLKPRTIVFYAGDNDIAAKRTPEQVRDDFKTFVATVHKELPKTKIVFLAVKPSPKRWALVEVQRKANGLVADYCKGDNRLAFVDVFAPMLDRDGNPRPELYAKDELHLSPEGYKLWTSLVKPHVK